MPLGWDPVDHPDLVGYRIYFGTETGVYPFFVDVDLVTEFTVNGLQTCTTYYLALKARASDGTESEDVSSEVSGWPRPEILSIGPATVTRGAQVDLTVLGWNFQSGATVVFADPEITLNSATVSECGEMIVNISAGLSAQLGPSDLSIVNPDQTFVSATGMISVVD